MIKTFGRMPASKPEGALVRINFPVLAMMDQTTGDGRRLSSAGGGARPTPSGTWSISAQFRKDIGHYGAELTGALHEISFDDQTGVVSGAGFLSDNEFGRRHAMAVRSGAMAGNSVGLAEVSARFVEDLDTGEYWVEFTKWNIADTSGVMTPAFIEAYATIEDEITAALGATYDDDEVLVASCAGLWSFSVPEPTDEVAELIASATCATAAYADFFRAEADELTKIVVTADGKVFGHLCGWDQPHASMAGNVRPPRPRDGYRSFNKPGVLTERGIVPTGPIFAYGGHKRGEDLDAAYGGIENAWCDVRVTEGRFGPWISGVVRPGVSDETVYAARASRISGHWIKGELRAVVSVNTEGYSVAGPDADVLDFSSRLAYRMEGDEVVELVASLDPTPAQDEQTYGSSRTVSTGTGVNLVFNVPGSPDLSEALAQMLRSGSASPAPAPAAEPETADETFLIDASLIDDDLVLALLLDEQGA